MSRIGSPPPRPFQPAPETPDKPKHSGLTESHIADFLTAEQQHALASGDVEAQQLADDAALAMGIQASLDEMDKAKNTEKPASRTITDLEFNTQRRITGDLRNWFAEKNMTVVPNKGKNMNCLVISLLQHVTGIYDNEHTEEASRYKDMLVNSSQGQIGKYDPLYHDIPLITALVYKINEDKESDMKVNFYSAGHDGKLGIWSVGEGKNEVIIFDQAGHYEAVVSGNLRQAPK